MSVAVIAEWQRTWGEVVSYVAAINHGVVTFDELPVPVRLIRELPATRRFAEKQ